MQRQGALLYILLLETLPLLFSDKTQISPDKSSTGALFHRPVFPKQLHSTAEAIDTGTMLSILYMNLQQYDIR